MFAHAARRLRPLGEVLFDRGVISLLLSSGGKLRGIVVAAAATSAAIRSHRGPTTISRGL